MIADQPFEEVKPLLVRNSDGKIPYPYLRTAAQKGRLDLLVYMLAHTPIADQKKLNDLLMYSALSGNIDVVTHLLSLGATEKVYAEGETILPEAGMIERSIKYTRDIEFTMALIEMGFYINKDAVLSMKQKKWLNPDSRKIIGALEEKGLL